MLGDPRTPMWITEGQKKSDALASHGLCAIALLGVWGFKGKNPFGGTTILADFDAIALDGRDVRLVFDSDVMTKPQVRQALDRLTEHLQRKGAHVTAVYLPHADGTKVGVDDYLLSHTVQELEGLIDAPRPQPQPAAPIVELLDDPPMMLTRPLTLINGRAYAATWLWTKTTVRELAKSDGTVEKLSEPCITEAPHLFVVRGDGVVFGDGVDCPMSELGMIIRLADKPPDDLLWTTKGVKAYRRGKRPNPSDVFTQVAKVYDHFLDFSRSLDEQPLMCQLSACFSLMTWFADAFTVLPYPWPNSLMPGSGKTKWGNCWTKTAYLGYLTSASGSFAALRDLAELGATILFDDAEVLADVHKADPDKQALILAGNRKGVKIPLKELGPDRQWHMRWVNAYCPRGFTALKLPFRALQSRSIVIPLIASADPARANRDPENEHDWPVDRKHLVEDLWALALWLQREASDIWLDMSTETKAVGRDWERWRSIMAVARLFERHGVNKLERDMRQVMRAYQDEKADWEGTSRETLVIRALMRIVGLKDPDMWTTLDMSDMSSERVSVQASKVCTEVKAILEEEGEGTDAEESQEEGRNTRQWVNPQTVGILLSRLRLPKDRDTSRTRDRRRLASQVDIYKLAMAYHVVRVSSNMSDTSAHVHLSDDEQRSDTSPTAPDSPHVHVSDVSAGGEITPQDAHSDVQEDTANAIIPTHLTQQAWEEI